MPDPSSQDVASFCEFTGAGPQTAIEFLKRYSSTDTAVSQYFENNGILPAVTVVRETWDEGAFHADRDQQYGPENRPQQSGFNVQGADALNPGVFQPTLSRPPSRVSTYGSQGGGEAARGIDHGAPWTYARGAQESGVVSSSGQTFRKVEHEYHDTQNWALTIPTFSEREMTQNPEPARRARESGMPAFLKPVQSAHYLPALITILHSIPMAKEALLARDLDLPDYGANNEWWDGNPIESSKVIFVDNPSGDMEMNADLVFETQRLMAFLEQTDRAYGSAQNLLQNSNVRNGDNRPAADFLKAWQDAMSELKPDDPLKDIFNSIAVNDPLETAKGQPPTASLTEFQVPVTEQVMELGGSLYDALDEMVWPEDDGDAVPSVYVQVGEILVARVTNNRSGSAGIGIDVPPVFYPDRYLEASVSQVQKMRAERVSLIGQINQISDLQAKLSVVPNPSDPLNHISAIAMIDHTKAYFEETPSTQSSVNPARGGDVLVDIASEGGSFKYGEVSDELQKMLENVALRIKTLEQNKMSAMQEAREVTRAFREPDTHPEPVELHPYTLRGVSTDSNIIYVLANPNTTEDLIDTAAEEWQWWRLTYDQHTEPPLQREKVSRDEVLSAARNESPEVLLVYASEAAVSYPAEPIPPRLRNFVRADNLAFARELEQASRRSTPTKRKASEMHEEADWMTWSNSDEGRQTPVNITVSDDEGMPDPPPYDSMIGANAQDDAAPWSHYTRNEKLHRTSDEKPDKFPEYEDVDLLTGSVHVAGPEEMKGIDQDQSDTNATLIDTSIVPPIVGERAPAKQANTSRMEGVEHIENRQGG